jgi:putative peptidoglycan lipid II flippase
MSIESEGSAPAEARLGVAFAKLFAGGVLGKALGVVRELALAASFGTGSAAGAFRAAQVATILPTHFFVSDTLNAGFIPLCARYLRDDPDRARALFWSVFALLNAIGIALAALLFLAAAPIASVLVPGFPTEQQALTAAMMRAMAVGVPFYVQATLASYVEMAHGRYFVASIRTGVQNVGLIVGVIAAALTGNPLLLGWGFTGFCVLFALIGVGSVARAGLLGRPHDVDWHEARSVLRDFAIVIAPLVLLPLLQQGGHAVERVVASLVDARAVPAVDYARAISDTGLALLAVPLGMAGLAELGRVDAAVARRQTRRMLRPLLLVTVPCSLFLVLHAESVVRLVFGRGAFGEESVAVTTLVLLGLAAGFWAQVTAYVLAKAMSAQGHNWKVAAITAMASLAHVGTNVLLFRALGALALGIAASAQALVLLFLAARALRVGRDVSLILIPLTVGAAGYLLLTKVIGARVDMSLPAAGGVFFSYWLVLLAALHVLAARIPRANWIDPVFPGRSDEA